jgi:spore germination protein YaaH
LWLQVNLTANRSGVADGRRHQLWFDTPRSFGLKASAAIEGLGLRGVGLWLPELAATAEQAAEMWRAIPEG